MAGLVKKIALIALLNKRTHTRNKNLVASQDFKIELSDDSVIHVAKGKHLVAGENSLGIGTIPFEDDEEDGLALSLLKIFANSQSAKIKYYNWDDIDIIYD